MLKTFSFIFFYCFFFVQTLAANDHFAVQVGLFLNPKLSDFESIKPLGYLYAEEDEGSTFRIFVGDFDNVQTAAAAESQIRQNGFTDASVVRRSTTLGKSVAVVQLATRSFKEKINWAPFYEVGNIFVLVENNQLKIVTGTYANVNDAKLELSKIKAKGFKDAFPKIINNALLHQPGAFELGDFKQPLIPLALDNLEKVNTTRNDPKFTTKGATPTSFEFDENNSTVANLSVPRIRSNVKRRSVLELQTTLKGIKVYTGSIDGLYGDGTADAFAQAANSNVQYKKYKLLSQYATQLKSGTDKTTVPPLQTAINTIWEAPDEAYKVFTRSTQPLAKAYQAYWLFQKNGPSSGVNNLMNGAISAAFQGVSATNRPPLDPKATYAYNDLEQVIRHLVYIHRAQNDYTVPCWMFERHPKEVNSAISGGVSPNLAADCNSFAQWESVRVLQALTSDISENATNTVSSQLSKLYLAPASLSQTEIDGLMAWNELLWQNLNAWSSRDPLNQKLVVTLKLAYFQTQIQLEDHYMDRGFSPVQASGLALATLKAIIGTDLERFI